MYEITAANPYSGMSLQKMEELRAIKVRNMEKTGIRLASMPHRLEEYWLILKEQSRAIAELDVAIEEKENGL